MAILLVRYPGNLLLTLAIAANLTVLGYFKYRLFFLGIIGDLVGEDWGLGTLFIPLAVSFFTFQQIAFLVNVRTGTSSPGRISDYAFFVSFFPQLIAGPIVLHREMRDQIASRHESNDSTLNWIAVGLVIFLFGLFKKVVLADSIGTFSDIAFTNYFYLTMLEAWAGAVAFMLELYFDFSGYADMAVGLGLMFGFQLPANFARPYRTTSMINFWKAWHITMTRFFVAHVFTPISLSLTRRFGRSAVAMRFTLTVAWPILLTFAVSGLWHGASWSFIMFGVSVAVFLVVNHIWRRASLLLLPEFVGWLLTMFAMCISFVYFRAGTLEIAHAYLARMLDPSHLFLPPWLSEMGLLLHLPVQPMILFSSGSDTVQFVLGLLFLGILSILLPDPANRPETVKLNWLTAVTTAFVTLIALGQLDEPQVFIYFQF